MTWKRVRVRSKITPCLKKKALRGRSRSCPARAGYHLVLSTQRSVLPRGNPGEDIRVTGPRKGRMGAWEPEHLIHDGLYRLNRCAHVPAASLSTPPPPPRALFVTPITLLALLHSSSSREFSTLGQYHLFDCTVDFLIMHSSIRKF